MTQARAQATRNTVLMAAAAVFERKGFSGATIADILEEAAVTKGALYFHFESKEALATAIVEQQADWREANTPASTWVVQRLIDLSFQFAQALRIDPLVRASIRLTLERNTFLSEDPGPYLGWTAAVRDLLEAAADAGELTAEAEPDAAAAMLVATLTGTQLVSEALSRRTDILERVEYMWVLLLPGLVKPEVREKLATRPPAVALR